MGYIYTKLLIELQIASVTSTEQLRSLLSGEDFNFLFHCGYSKPTTNVTLGDKEEITRSVWLHFVYFHPHAELEQLRKGFRETLQVELLICRFCDDVWWTLVPSSAFDVTIEDLTESFAVLYSENGSNNRTKEEAIVYFWYEYITESAGNFDNVFEMSITCTDLALTLSISVPVGRSVTTAEIVQFLSGATRIPAIGFDTTPKVRFTDEECLPRVSTCDVAITFPRSMGLMRFDKFCEILDMCIKGSFGFGSV